MRRPMLQIFVYQSIWRFDVLLLKSLLHHDTFAGKIKLIYRHYEKNNLPFFAI
jgi:hypothetical protein